MPSRSKEFLTAASGSSSVQPSSEATPPAAKAKRPRKRTRNKKRTADTDSDPDTDEEVAKASEASTVPATTKASSIDVHEEKEPADASGEDDNHNNDDDDSKRKRKRKRSTKKKTDSEKAPSSDKIVDVGPDPNTDLRLSEQARQAIIYAQTYTGNKTQWKFNKARQNWLLRNALSIPPADYESTLARVASGEKQGEAKGRDGDDEEGENFVPDDFMPVVSAYLKSVLGGARSRLITTLNEACNAAEVVTPSHNETSDSPAKPAPVAETAGAETPGARKTVSFADIAMEQESSQQAKAETPSSTDEAGATAGPDARTVELKRTRARSLLQHMGETC